MSKKCWEVAKKILAASSKLHIKSPGKYFSSHFLMFDDPFCQFVTFSRDILEGLSKLFSLSAEDRFERKKSFEQTGVSLMNFGVRAKIF